ncbi:solute:sodium symporter family transporter [Testudinibacter aquarius]|uniref:SSS family solute:Na+ symporter n=1 Tax=Testudinibacter aquarius TaxID=1524974 RepID=A0A4R3Y9Z2_9PAST|nr:solute:sodium symporter family transporter [Testudinibacter aquarius]KAE9525882.1 solute:sodium symporter family transporter [Testudinibacter aquarius]TCV88746.1 SSS family solute:Na+ symporter [Testudinibacter aquarius]TNG93498.1 solute:sodium symporter family transporter [Testudinibacter aquarius]
MFALFTCLAFMLFVAWYSWHKTKGTVSTSDGYFLAGNKLGALFIAGSLLLTNISTEQLVGQSGLTYFGNMTPLAWEIWAIRGIILLAILFLPMYLGGAFSTMPEFLSSHYGEGTRKLIVYLFMFGYIFVWSPTVLYGGALALMKILDLEAWLGLSKMQALWLTTIVVGVIGAIYAITGGLKAVAVSDTLNGVGLLIIGCLIPILGLMALGDKIQGNMLDALHYITITNPEKLDAIGVGSKLDAIPIAAVFTGLMVTATFYWGTNQFVIQRALGAESLKAGQKGLLMAGFFKMLVPFIAMFPGLLAFHLYGAGLEPRDLAYPTLVAKILPAPLLGLFVAVLLGAVFSTYNSLINSASTLFAVDIYKPLINQQADDTKVINVSKKFGIFCSVLTIMIAPNLVYAPQGLFIFLQQFSGFIAIPIVSLVLIGLFGKHLRVSEAAAKFIIIFHLITYYLLVFALKEYIHIHWMHVYGLLFIVEMAMLIIWAKAKPAAEKEVKTVRKAKINMQAWRYSLLTSGILLSCATLIYVTFSKVGLAYAEAVVSPDFGFYFGLAVLICALFCAWLHIKIQPIYERYINSRYQQTSANGGK